MKKLIICSLLLAFALISYGQVTQTGNGTPVNPYVLRWKVSNVDTTINMPTNETSNRLLKNYTVFWQVHYSGTGTSDCNVYPVHAAAPGDSMRCVMDVDTTKTVLNGTGYAPNWKNKVFYGADSPGTIFGFHFTTGSTRPAYIWFYQIYKPKN